MRAALTPGSLEKNEKSRVGYKKPPERSRFRKGQSGNPKGRPKGSKNKPTMSEGAYHFQQFLASGLAKTVRAPKPKTTTAERMLKRSLTAGYPRQEHCQFDDMVRYVTIIGPMNSDENIVWHGLEERERRLMGDLIDELQAIIHAEDGYIRREMHAAASFSQDLLEEVRAEKEKFRRRITYDDFSKLQSENKKK